MPQHDGRLFGLIGYPLYHSFSKKYFSEKFRNEGLLNCRFELFPLPDIAALPQLLAEHPDLCGLNVTIPHKQNVIPFLQELEPEASTVGAINCIRIYGGKLTGYNTDIFGFELSLLHFLKGVRPAQSLILGTGGAARAVAYVLKKLNLPYRLVSRRPAPGVLTYEDLTPACIAKSRLIINTTPIGTFPKTEECPPLPYDQLGENHLLFDLVYNPQKTLFLARGETQGARIRNGLEMFSLQAEKAWEIWNADVTQ
ncbi:MAG: shikimate dehydrogenase [Saprospiraceae bacterium]|nr:MAG: shikimate dehydrogenase [Saprospiraceae bacterium]